MSKKILSVVLALALVLTTFAVSAFAVGGTGFEDDNTKTQTWALSDPRDNGNGTYDVDVILTANYVVGTISFQVTNPDAEDGKLVGAELTSVKKGAALTYDANIQKNKTSGLVAIIPEPGNEDEKGVDLTNGGVIATLTFTLKAESAEIAIKNDPKTKTNQGGNLIAVRLDDENLTTATWIYGQTVVSVGSTKTLGAAAAADPELAVIDGTIGVIDDSKTEYGVDYNACDGYIYGIEPESGESIDAVFEVIGDGEMEVIPNEAGSDCGTGTLVNVLDLDGNVVATYVLIIFGDIDGDGQITSFDGSDAIDHDGYAYGENLRIEAPEVIFAGDIDVDGDITAFDGSDFIDHDGYAYGETMRIYQADIMARL